MNALGFDFSGVGIESPTFDVWISENNYYLMKLSFNLTMSDSEGLSEIFIFSNINQPVNVTLPADAKNAEALSASEWLQGTWRYK